MGKKIIRSADLKKVQMLILDVDGVLTDGNIGYDSQGNEYRVFNVHDGYGLRLAREAGLIIVIISGKISPIVSQRAKVLGINEVYLGVENKKEVLGQLLYKYKLAVSQVVAIGDDLLDLELLSQVGVSVAVANARPEVKKVAKFITRLPGGAGAVREVVDLILEAKGQRLKAKGL